MCDDDNDDDYTGCCCSGYSGDEDVQEWWDARTETAMQGSPESWLPSEVKWKWAVSLAGRVILWVCREAVVGGDIERGGCCSTGGLMAVWGAVRWVHRFLGLAFLLVCVVCGLPELTPPFIIAQRCRVTARSGRLHARKGLVGDCRAAGQPGKWACPRCLLGGPAHCTLHVARCTTHDARAGQLQRLAGGQRSQNVPNGHLQLHQNRPKKCSKREGETLSPVCIHIWIWVCLFQGLGYVLQLILPIACWCSGGSWQRKLQLRASKNMRSRVLFPAVGGGPLGEGRPQAFSCLGPWGGLVVDLDLGGGALLILLTSGLALVGVSGGTAGCLRGQFLFGGGSFFWLVFVLLTPRLPPTQNQTTPMTNELCNPDSSAHQNSNNLVCLPQEVGIR